MEEDLVLEIDCRCPVPGGPEALLVRIETGEDEEALEELAKRDILICITCSWCYRTLRKFNPQLRRVVHKFDLTGAHRDTIME